MIKLKHFLEAAEPDDGQRIWAEPLGLTRDLREWCHVDLMMSHLGPPRELWDWFNEHPDGYDFFRGRYHENLKQSSYGDTLYNLACTAVREDITLLYDGEDPEHNTATALYEFISELEAYCPREEDR